MGVTLKKVVENINTLSNKQNSEIIIKYLNYLIEKGNSINSQIAYLKAVYYYAKYLKKSLERMSKWSAIKQCTD